jgi:glucoamylase
MLRTRLTRIGGAVAVVALTLLAVAAPHARAASGVAPGAPGATALWTAGNKDGFGAATGLGSRVWYTLGGGELTEVYYPNLGTPAVRDLQFVVSDGRSFVAREHEDARHALSVTDPGSLSYRQVSTDPAGRYRLTKTYTTDPDRSVLLIRVHLESHSKRPLSVYALYDPSLSANGDDDSGSTVGRALVASDKQAASALVATPAFTKTSNGYLGTSDGWSDLRDDESMDWSYSSAPSGNVVQTGRLELTGKPGSQDATVALGFGPSTPMALAATRDSLASGYASAERAYQAGWHRYLAGRPRPRSVAGHERLYDVSLMVLAASEDKTYRGGGIASPSMAWIWGQLAGYNGPYHLVWSRDLYEMATAQIVAGDRSAAERALDYLWTRQQKPDGCLPQNSNLDGSPHWGGLQLDEVADPILLSWQLGRTDGGTWSHVQAAAECILANGPATQERWENATGYSPASIAAEIAGLVCAAQIAQVNGATDAAARYRAAADAWRSQIRRWTVTTTGPLSAQPYFLRLSVDGDANAGTSYMLADGGPTVDQRSVVDSSFLELVRLGVVRADDPDVESTLPVVDRELAVDTPNGQFWHRYTHDGYGETLDGRPFGTNDGIGRAWPIFAGERGEYELAASELTGDARTGRAAASKRLDAIAATANDGLLLPEQVWDHNPPAGTPGNAPGTGTGSATPLGWTHAQFIRLAWSIDVGRPVERPDLVSCRYAGLCLSRTGG